MGWLAEKLAEKDHKVISLNFIAATIDTSIKLIFRSKVAGKENREAILGPSKLYELSLNHHK